VLSDAFDPQALQHRYTNSRRPDRRLFCAGFRSGAFIAHSQNKADGTGDIAEHRVSPFVGRRGQRQDTRRYSMTNRLMISVAAAALIAGTGFANAQGTGTEHNAPSAEHAAPSSATPMNRNDSAHSGAAQSDEKMQSPGAKNQRAEDNMKANPKGEKSAQDNNMRANPRDEKSAQDNNMKSDQPRGMNAQTERGSAEKDMKAEGREDRNGSMKAESKSATENRSQTTGQAGAGAKLSGEQRTKITTVIRDQHVAPVNDVNFSIAVGTRVPRDVSFHPLPTEIVNIYPDWRGYEFILVREQIIVVDPRTFEIVAVLDA
jgi:hypothetical protein